jgi:transcriptional regulator with XRE-family HTH domain
MKNRVKEIRQRAGLKQVALASRTSIDQSVLSLIENNWKKPTPAQADRIKEVLGPEAIPEDQNR